MLPNIGDEFLVYSSLFEAASFSKIFPSLVGFVYVVCWLNKEEPDFCYEALLKILDKGFDAGFSC